MSEGPLLVSMAAFAELLGVTGQYVSALGKAGRLVLVTVDGRELVDVVASRARIAATADPSRQHVREHHAQQRAQKALGLDREGPSTAAWDGLLPGDTTVFSAFQKARAEKEGHLAALARMQREEREGALVHVDQVKAAGAELARIVVKGLENLPARVGPLIGQEPDALKREAILEAELRRIQEEFAQAVEQLLEQGAEKDAPH